MDSWKEKYRQILDNDSNDSSTKEANKLKWKHRPKYLYKYFPFSNYSIDSLKEKKIWCSKPISYNDPFEFKEYCDFNKIAIFCSSEVLEDNYKRDYLTVIQRNYLVSCFSESPFNILMWSHYANKHMGFCVEYDMSKLTKAEFCKYFHPICYGNSIPDATKHYKEDEIKITLSRIFLSGISKSMNWQYENEWRIIVPNLDEDIRKQYFELHNVISKVYLGDRMLARNRKRIINICKKDNIPVIRLRQSYNKYTLEEDIDN